MLRYSLWRRSDPEPDLPEAYGSDNSSAADNQQERLIKIGWITGFVGDEGCFSIHVVSSLSGTIDEVINRLPGTTSLW